VDKEQLFQILKQQAIALEKLLEPFCEIVIHDFSDLEHSIISIEGNLTGRSVGGPPTNLLLSKVKKGNTEEDALNYITSMPEGRLMKSSTVFIRDKSGKAFGAFCVNLDISDFVAVHRQLTSFILTEGDKGVEELFFESIESTIQSVVTSVLFDLGESVSTMTRDNKIELINRLHNTGIFQLRKAVPILADLLGLSRATIYNYLREESEDNRMYVET
jgi:predicted transcriptional regulator YheO